MPVTTDTTLVINNLIQDVAYQCRVYGYCGGVSQGYFQIPFTINSGLRFTNENLMELETVSEIQTYPNPTYRYVIVSGCTENTVLQLYNLNGQLMSIPVIDRDELEVELDLEKLPTGIYILNIIQDGSIETRKIVRK